MHFAGMCGMLCAGSPDAVFSDSAFCASRSLLSAVFYAARAGDVMIKEHSADLIFDRTKNQIGTAVIAL